MNVTQQVVNTEQSYGGSPKANPEYYSTNKTLDFAKSSNSLLNARPELITSVPTTFAYKDSVGLFGAENVFIKVDLNIQSFKAFYQNIPSVLENDYYNIFVDTTDPDIDFFYDPAVLDFSLEFFPVNSYEQAVLNDNLDSILDPVVSVTLNNLKTGNKFVDAWFDVRLYTKDRMEHPYDNLYINPTSYFYIGFHARNTRRLPYNVSMTVGNSYISENSLTSEQRRYLV
jgi:hypothetical protein